MEEENQQGDWPSVDQRYQMEEAAGGVGRW